MLSNNVTSYPFLFGSAWTYFQHSNHLQLEMVWGGIIQKRVILLWTNAPSYALAHNYCYCHAYLSSSRFIFFLLWGHKRKKKIWKLFRRRGLAVWWKMFLKNYNKYNYDTFLDQTNNDLVMFRPVPYTSIAVNFYVHVRGLLREPLTTTTLWMYTGLKILGFVII